MDTLHSGGSDAMSGHVLEARNVVRSYPGTLALKGVDFRVHRHKVNVLIGENGAGKSTLMRIMAGVEAPSSGELILDGERISLRSTSDAARHGIMMVHQELNVLPNLDVAENVFAGRELRTRLGWVRKGAQRQASASALGRLSASFSALSRIGALPLGQQQIVELARSLAHRARVLILDEPTSALSQAECTHLFRVIEDLKAHGVSIVYISHRLHELLAIGDHFTVLRDGSVAGEAVRADVDRHWIVERMTGRSELRQAAIPASRAKTPQPEALRVERLQVTATRADGGERIALEDVTFALRAGEIVGIYGLLGSGRTELLETLGGLRRASQGDVVVAGKRCRFRSVAEAMRAGVVLLPEDRQRDALLPERSIRENLSLAGLGRLHAWPWQLRRVENESVRRLRQEFGIKASNLELPVRSLSGGNQQKVILARCLLCRPSVLLLDEPTRGVDVGAKAEIYSILRRLAGEGLAVLFTSSEMEELAALADRVLVLCNGAVSRTLMRDQVTEDALFAAAAPREPVAATPERMSWQSQGA